VKHAGSNRAPGLPDGSPAASDGLPAAPDGSPAASAGAAAAAASQDAPPTLKGPAPAPQGAPRVIPLVERAFERYVRGQFARHFASIRWSSVTDRATGDDAVPTLGIANHTNWWDGFFALLISRELGLTPHILMEAAHLARYGAFRRFGALPLRRDRLRGAYADLLAADRCLQPGHLLWMFPSGSRRPQGERPAGFERGAAHLALVHAVPVRVCPVAFRYVYLGEQMPEGFALVGQPTLVAPGDPRARRRELTKCFEREVAETVDALDEHLRAEALGGFRVLVSGRLSVNKRMDRFRHAVGLLRGPFETRNG
jgi:chlorobactene lauroyltransferase